MRAINKKDYSYYEIESGFRATFFDFEQARRVFNERNGRATFIGVKFNGDRAIIDEK